MKSKISLFLTGISYIAGSFANVSTTSLTSYTHKPLPSDSASLSKDWINVGNSIRRGMSEYETSKEYAGKRKK
ncbi:hypothetical protein H3N56_03040 [Cetobacterium sp. 2A]|uniref:hypothetical protein n=1 Tax=Cetobacterium sp. 2A TaxID=2754723 RepID=UPI00163C8005|nr:hypothetical protein [Cetobacterium sp. 2A]MBC2855470.1 hypothetical protein [Cetobacterium sp. 2A]